MPSNMIIPGVSQLPQYMLRGSVTFAAGTSGAVSQHTVFTITGMVAFVFYVRCTDPLTSGGAATISHGNAGLVTALGVATTATTIDANDMLVPMDSTTWQEAGTFSGVAQHPFISPSVNITADILTATITGGTLEYYCIWSPLSVGATVERGAELTAL